MSGYVPFLKRAEAATPATVATLSTPERANCRNVASVAAVHDLESGSDDGNFAERAAMAEYEGGLSREHSEALAALQVMPPPDGIHPAQVAVVIDAAARFLDSRRKRP
jgi:hypothetical protein